MRQGGHQPGKHGNVGEFESGQRKVGEFESNQGKVMENVLLLVVCCHEL